MHGEHEQPRTDVEVRHPLVGIALAFALGLALSPRVPAQAFGFLWLGAALLGAASCALRPCAAGSAAALAAWLAAGLLRGSLEAPGLSAREIAPGCPGGRGQVELVVAVTDDPVLALRSAEGGRDRWEFAASMEGARISSPYWTRARGSVKVRMAPSSDGPDPAYGDRWRLSGVLTRDRSGRGGADLLDVRAGRGERLSTGGGCALVRWCYERRRAARDTLHRGLERYPAEAAVQEALVVGYREGIPEAVHDDFQRTGTIHIFAISGLHVALMAGLLLAVLRAAGLSKPAWAWGLIPMLTIYTLSTGAAASAVRALVMASVYWSAHAMRRRPDIASSLALSALAILAVAPDQIREPGFLYSFVAVWGLIALTPVFLRPFERWLRTDPLQAAPEKGWPAIRRWALGSLAGLLATSAAAWVVSTPLTALFAHQVAPIALAANLIAVPGSFLITLTGCLSLLFGSVSGVMAEVFNHANRLFAALMMAGIHAMFRVPWGHAFVCAPPLWALAVWYGGIGGLLLLRGRLRLVLTCALAAVAAGAAVRGWTDRDFAIEFPRAGLAPAALVNGPGGGDVLIDPGASWQARGLVRWLRARGVDSLEAMVITQPDGDHAGGAVDVARQVPVRRLWIPRTGGGSAIYREAVSGLAEMGLGICAVTNGAAAGGPSGIRLVFVRPDAPVGRRAEDAAMAVRVEAGKTGAAAWMAGPATAALRGAAAAAGVTRPAGLLVADGAAAGESADAWAFASHPSRILTRGLRWEIGESGEAGTGGPPPGGRFVLDPVEGRRFDLVRGGRVSTGVRPLAP